jgi:hypothetical protein
MKQPTQFDTALASFDDAMRIAERHRNELKNRFGFTDKQIGSAVMARRAKQRGGAMKKLARATLAARLRMDNGT